MRRTLLALAALVVLVLPAHAGQEVTIFSAVSAASGSYTDPMGRAAFRTAGYPTVRWQACGSNFSGTLNVLQGAKATTTVSVLPDGALSLSSYTGCSVTYYRTLKPAAWTDFDYTRSAGTLTVYLELAP